MQEHRIGSAHSALQPIGLSALFQFLPSSVATGLIATRFSPTTAIVIDVESAVPEMSSTDVMVSYDLPTSSCAGYVTIALPVHKRGSSSTIARSPKYYCLITATEAVTAVEEEENVLRCSNTTNLLHLSSEAAVAEEKLLQALEMVSCVNKIDFRNIHKIHELLDGEDLAESVDPFLCEPPYNVRRQQGH